MDHTALQAVLPDCQVRAATLDDVPAMTALIGRITTVLLGFADASDSELRDDLTGVRFDIERDTILALDADGRAVVYAQGFDENDDYGWIDVYVDLGLDEATFDAAADAAVSACLGQIRRSAAARGASAVRVKAGLYQQESQMRAVYERAGLAIDARYWRMEVALAPDADYTFTLPAGIELRPVDPLDDEVLRAATALINDAFAEHHGHHDHTFSDMETYWRGTEKFDPEAWWFAYQDGAAVGFLLGDDSRADEGVGYVRSLGVTKSARGSGIAKALLLNTFDHYRARGRRAVQLGVDSQNTTGATRLYEGVGMRPMLTTFALLGEFPT